MKEKLNQTESNFSKQLKHNQQRKGKKEKDHYLGKDSSLANKGNSKKQSPLEVSFNTDPNETQPNIRQNKWESKKIFLKSIVNVVPNKPEQQLGDPSISSHVTTTKSESLFLKSFSCNGKRKLKLFDCFRRHESKDSEV